GSAVELGRGHRLLPGALRARCGHCPTGDGQLDARHQGCHQGCRQDGRQDEGRPAGFQGRGRAALTAPDPFFVIGTGRSGTTVTARCLGAHPALLFVDEPRLVSDILLPFAAGELTLDQAQHRLEIEEDGSGKEPMKFLRRTREHYGERLGSAGLAELREQTRAACQTFFAAAPLLDADAGAAALRELIAGLVQWTTSRLGGQRWLIKQPDLCTLLERTSTLLPAARFVHVVRAPLDVLSSRVDRGFQPDFDAAFEVWFARLRRVAEFSRRMPERITHMN